MAKFLRVRALGAACSLSLLLLLVLFFGIGQAASGPGDAVNRYVAPRG